MVEGNMSDNNRDPVFYYSRDRRLQRASQTVQDAYKQPKRRGLIGLFGSRGNFMILICIILIIAMIGLGNFIVRRNDGPRLGGNILNLSIVSEEEVLLLGLLKRAPARGEIYIGDVDIIVSPSGNALDEPEFFVHRVIFNPVEKETFFIALPFEGDDFFVILRTKDEQVAFSLKP